jgi:hypothetical protein
MNFFAALIFAICISHVGLLAQDEQPYQSHVKISTGDLEVVIADNAEYEGHRAWYNGVAHLSHKAKPGNHFWQRVAGMNFEHIWDGEKWWEPAKVLFEPRSSEMVLHQLSETSVQLHMPPSNLHKLESWTTYTVTAPHYIDMDFFCIPRKETFDRGYIGLFWASYINTTDPEEKPIYFIGSHKDSRKRNWIKWMTTEHALNGTVRYQEDVRSLSFNPRQRKMLYTSVADSLYAYPFYYGLRDGMVHIMMFDSPGPIRFSHSPSSGGPVKPGTNPAWDWQYIIHDYEVGESYGYKARMVYKPWVGRDDVIAEYESWSGHKVTLTE